MAAVRGELDVDRPPVFSRKQPQQGADAREERRARRQAVEGDDGRLPAQLPVEANRAARAVGVDGRQHLADGRQIAPAFREQRADLHRLEPARFEVDEIDPARRVAHDLVGGDVDAQPGLPGREEHRIVVRQAIDGARAEARHEAHEAVLAADPRGPAQLVVAEGDAGVRRQEVAADAGADHFLDHHRHFLVEIEEPALGPVLDRVRAEQRGVDLRHGVEQRAEALALGALVREEEALVLARERRTDPILEQAASCAR